MQEKVSPEWCAKLISEFGEYAYLADQINILIDKVYKEGVKATPPPVKKRFILF